MLGQVDQRREVRWRLPSRRIVAITGFIASTVAAIAFALNPTGVGLGIFALVCAVHLAVVLLAPYARRVRPRRVWIPQSISTLLLMASLSGSALEMRVGPISYIELAGIAAYVSLVVWLGILSQWVERTSDPTAALDTSAVFAGAILALWATTVAPQLGEAYRPEVFVWAAHPTLDALLLALAGHVAFRMRRLIPSMVWLLVALSILLVLDTSSALLALYSQSGQWAWVTSLYVYAYFALAMGASHRSVLLWTRRTLPHERATRHGGQPALVVFTMAPVVQSTAIPVTGQIDIIVRCFFVGLIMLLVFVRLSFTMMRARRAEEISHHRATHDELTGLITRAALVSRLERRLARNAVVGKSTAVLFLDCDDFKHVNDTWGHRAGDAVLTHIATHLPKLLGPSRVLARQGGDEFVIVSTVESEEEALELARQVRGSFGTPIRILPDRDHLVTPSIGVALCNSTDEVSPDELISNADTAMYEAKRRGRGRIAFFDALLAERTRVRTAIADRLDAAIAQEAFELALQPIMGGEHYEVLIGWEALARWRDPDLGQVPPSEFIVIAEQHGLIDALGEVLLRQACHQLALLRTELGASELIMSVNVSPAQLEQPGFVDLVRNAREAVGLPQGSLWQEVTETLLVDEGPEVAATLAQLSDAGVVLCVDDFGTGYASLATLMRLPVNCVKLDISLVDRIDADPQAVRQLEAVIDLVTSLGISHVVAEGVETRAQAEALWELGCSMTQGWLFGRPTSVEAVLAEPAVVLQGRAVAQLPVITADLAALRAEYERDGGSSSR